MRHSKLFSGLLFLALMLFCGSCAMPGTAPAEYTANNETAASATPAGELTAVFFDVGQADSILISTGEHHMLVDAGNVGQEELLTAYLAEYGVSKLDYLVATHPHADHIGAMAAVVYGMDYIGQMLMPEAIANTQVFEKLLDALEQRNIEITTPQAGDSFKLGEATVTVLAPQDAEYDNLNNYSLVLRISFGQVNLLLTGDAEALSEEGQLQAGYQLQADVLKTGHHGSSTSSTEAYLTAVAPRYAIISCGADNSYGHPHAEVLQRLAEQQTQVYRTDEYGTLVLNTDGQQITLNAKGTPLPQTPSVQADIQPEIIAPNVDAPQDGYIGNQNSQVFHLPTCSSLPAEHNRLSFTSREDAVAQGYRPCKVCEP